MRLAMTGTPMRLLLLFLVKEARDARRNKTIWPVYLVLPHIAVALPVFFTLALPSLLAAAMQKQDDTLLAILRLVQAAEEFAGLPPEEAATRFLLRNLAGFYLLLPVVMSSISAAFSIVGEKQQRTLEPILATPITDRQLLLGKLLASLLPAVMVTWASALIAALIVDLITWQRYGAWVLPDRFWLVGVLALGPLLGVGAVLATIRLSARMSDPQAANQFTGLVIMPAFMLGLGLFGKLLTFSFAALCVACLVVALLDLALFRLNVTKFQREEILTRWK
jgi:ABC-2 type transport system permease protein